ncbi:MAG: trypsin-like peptidase domain-containing protein, partial [Acidobacteriota bacterium]
MTRKRAIISLLVIAALATYTVAAAGLPNPLQLFGLGQEAEPTPTAVPQHRGPVSAAPPPSFAAIARAARPAVVNVSTTHTVRTQGFPGFGPGPFGEQDPFSEFFRRFFGPMPPRSFTQRALGSGVIIDRHGYIVTNAHVVKNADKIVIKLEDKREFDTKVVGIDGKTDVALLKIHAPENLTVAPLGDSDALQVGDWVVAIGNPFGLSETVTAGIVSAKGRVIGEGPYDDFIQTDASINPGNSGGPLLDLHGTVVGINSAIFSRGGGNIGIGFAIPSNIVHVIMDQLIRFGEVRRGHIGLEVQELNVELAQAFGLDRKRGVV